MIMSQKKKKRWNTSVVMESFYLLYMRLSLYASNHIYYMIGFILNTGVNYNMDFYFEKFNFQNKSTLNERHHNYIYFSVIDSLPRL